VETITAWPVWGCPKARFCAIPDREPREQSSPHRLIGRRRKPQTPLATLGSPSLCKNPVRARKKRLGPYVSPMGGRARRGAAAGESAPAGLHSTARDENVAGGAGSALPGCCSADGAASPALAELIPAPPVYVPDGGRMGAGRPPSVPPERSWRRSFSSPGSGSGMRPSCFRPPQPARARASMRDTCGVGAGGLELVNRCRCSVPTQASP
jgi:hypothetical protein